MREARWPTASFYHVWRPSNSGGDVVEMGKILRKRTSLSVRKDSKGIFDFENVDTRAYLVLFGFAVVAVDESRFGSGGGSGIGSGPGFRSQTFPDKLVNCCRRVAQLVRALP